MSGEIYQIDDDLERILDGIYSHSTDFDRCYSLLNRGIVILSHENASLEDDSLLVSFGGFLGRFINNAQPDDVLGKYSSLVDNSYDFLLKNETFEEYVKVEYPGIKPATENKLLILKDYLKEEDPFEE